MKNHLFFQKPKQFSLECQILYSLQIFVFIQEDVNSVQKLGNSILCFSQQLSLNCIVATAAQVHGIVLTKFYISAKGLNASSCENLHFEFSDIGIFKSSSITVD